ERVVQPEDQVRRSEDQAAHRPHEPGSGDSGAASVGRRKRRGHTRGNPGGRHDQEDDDVDFDQDGAEEAREAAPHRRVIDMRLRRASIILILAAVPTFVVPRPILAQGHGNAHGQSNAGGPSGIGAEPAGVDVRNFGSWLDDASIAPPGNGTVNVSFGYYRTPLFHEIDMPVVDGGDRESVVDGRVREEGGAAWW